jgi:hypothetical protein
MQATATGLLIMLKNIFDVARSCQSNNFRKSICSTFIQVDLHNNLNRTFSNNNSTQDVAIATEQQVDIAAPISQHKGSGVAPVKKKSFQAGPSLDHFIYNSKLNQPNERLLNSKPNLLPAYLNNTIYQGYSQKGYYHTLSGEWP